MGRYVGVGMDTEIFALIARLRRNMPRNADVLAVCDELVAIAAEGDEEDQQEEAD